MGLDESFINTKRWIKCVRKCIVNKKEINPLNIPSMKIHSGFYESFKDIRQQLLQTVLTTYYRIIKKKKIPRFYITRHSLGGLSLKFLAYFWRFYLVINHQYIV